MRLKPGRYVCLIYLIGLCIFTWTQQHQRHDGVRAGPARPPRLRDSRNLTKISEALSSLGNVTVLPLDVADTASVAAAAQTVAEAGRGLDVLVNNAGIECVQPVLDVNITTAQRIFDINLWGPLRTIWAFADLLIASRGCIVNVSSSASVTNSPWVCKLIVLLPIYIRNCTLVPKSLVLHQLDPAHIVLFLSHLRVPTRQLHSCLSDTQGWAKRRTPLPRLG